MNLRLAIAVSEPITAGAQPASLVQFLNHETSQSISYAPQMVQFLSLAGTGDLVAVDESADPPQILFRWSRMQVENIDGDFIFTDLPHETAHGLRQAQGLTYTPSPGDWIFAANGEVCSLCIDGLPADPEFIRQKYFPQIEDLYRQMAVWAGLDPRQVVTEGYDQIAPAYLEWANGVRSEEREYYTALLIDRLPPGASLLELGCGAGKPTTERLAQRFSVTGVDISAAQIEKARQNVPSAHFRVADMSRMNFAPASFDAVAAFYSIIHLPREEYSSLFQKISAWLRPGGLFVASLGSRAALNDYDNDFLGARMYWSSFDPPTHRRLIENAGLVILSDRLITETEFDQPVTFQWIVAQKPQAG